MMKLIKLFAVVMLGGVMLSGCEKLDELDREAHERNLQNLRDWVINSNTTQEAIDEFGYENCFKIVPLESFFWNDYTTYYKGDLSDVNKNDLVEVRSLFYNKPAMSHIHIGEIICNKSIANDLLAIFRQLYESQYHIDQMMPVAEIDYTQITNGSTASYDFTFCFHFNSDPIDMAHVKGLAVVLNPYNPPTSASDQAVTLFKLHGFTWGGDDPNGKRFRFEKK